MIRNGPGWRVRTLTWLLRMPPGTDSAEVTLLVHRVSDSEIWMRTFETHTVSTTQSTGPTDTLQERFGVLEFSFNLEASDGQLKYHQRNAAIRLGFIRFDLPAFMWPRLYATEKAVPGRQDDVEVAVEVRLPSTRLLIAYSGAVSLPKDAGS